MERKRKPFELGISPIIWRRLLVSRDSTGSGMLKTPRLRLDSLNIGHAALVFHQLCDERIYSFIADISPESTVKLEERFADDCEQPIGQFQATVHADHTADIAYLVFPEYWGRGYAKEAGRRIITYLFEGLGCAVVTAFIDTENVRSVRLVEALGFIRKEVLIGIAVIRGRKSDEYRYELTVSNRRSLAAEPFS